MAKKKSKSKWLALLLLLGAGALLLMKKKPTTTTPPVLSGCPPQTCSGSSTIVIPKTISLNEKFVPTAVIKNLCLFPVKMQFSIFNMGFDKVFTPEQEIEVDFLAGETKTISFKEVTRVLKTDGKMGFIGRQECDTDPSGWKHLFQDWTEIKAI